MTPDQLDSFARSLRSGQYNLLLGAAASLGSTNGSGEPLPLAGDLVAELATLKKTKPTHTLQRLYQTLTDDEIASHITRRFKDSAPGDTLKAIPTFMWRRIFTLNIDDALENAFATSVSYQNIETRNWKDPFEEFDDRSIVPVIHLHGDVSRPSDGYIFSRQAYLTLIKQINPWMHVLAELIATEPFIILGSSLDEVDLDYFLSMRSQTTARLDRGPSILIEPFADAVTDRECERLGLLRFDGTGEDFINFLNREVRDRPRPDELIDDQSRGIFLTAPSTLELTSFYSDFERVPTATEPDAHDARFFFGHAPTWADLGQNYDVARPENVRIIKAIEDYFSGIDQRRLLLLSDVAGGGKTTSLRRVAFDLARQGMTVLMCDATSRLEPIQTAKMLENVAGRCVVLVDDFADQVYSIEAVLKSLLKMDILFLVAERNYRHKFISEVLSGINFRSQRPQKLSLNEAKQLIDTYLTVGLVGQKEYINKRDESASELVGEPVAVACCRILNDLRPLDRIVQSLMSEGTATDRRRYITAAIAEFCTKGGLRYDILARAASAVGLNAQFSTLHPLPLGFSSDRSKSFVVPLSATLGTRVCELFALENPEEMLTIYSELGRSIATRVTPIAIRKRSPEARLSGRLYDLDIAEKFLGQNVEKFYLATEPEWRWNSRYWEQRALLELYRSQSPDLGFDEVVNSRKLALAHAKQAVSLERHPLTLTTLSKILFNEANAVRASAKPLAEEAVAYLNEAIREERRRGRLSVQPFMVLFQGVKALPNGVKLSSANETVVRAHVTDAAKLFSNDAQVKELVDEVRRKMTN